jgi:Uma2 family endonuclease
LETRSQCPLALTEVDEPEPDVMVVSLGAALYAAAGVVEYWVFDLGSRWVVVHTDPGPNGYTTLRTVQTGALLLAAFPEVMLRGDLLFP